MATGKRVIAGILLLVAPGLIAAADDPRAAIPLDFASPAQVSGNTVSQVQAVLMFFHNGSAGGSFDIEIGSATNRTFVRTTFDLAAHQVGGSPATELPTRTQPTASEASGTIRFKGLDWASLMIEADSISVSTWNASSQLQVLAAQDRFDDALETDFRSNPANPGESVQEPMVAIGTEDLTHFGLRAEGITRLRWSNLEVACAVSDGCPDDARGTNRTYSAATGDWMRVRTVSFMELNATAGIVEISGHAASLVGVGAPMTVEGDGAIRLPLSVRTEDCSRCFDPDGSTIGGEGHFVLSDLMPPTTGRARITGELHGNLTALRVDEGFRDPRSLWGEWQTAAIGGTVAAVGLALVWRLLLPLFSRIVTREDAIRSTTRAIILQAVRDNPGQTYRGLMKVTRKSDGSVRHHLAHLSRHAYVSAHRHLGRVLYFEAREGVQRNWEAMATTRDANLQRLRDVIIAMPGATQVDLILHGRTAWGDSRKTTQKRLGCLVASKLVNVKRDGKTNRYSIGQPAALAKSLQ